MCIQMMLCNVFCMFDVKAIIQSHKYNHFSRLTMAIKINFGCWFNTKTHTVLFPDTAMSAPRPRARSRSRTRSPADSPHRARHSHPLAHFPQPEEVATTRSWVQLTQEIYNLRHAIGFLGLLLAAVVNLPITLGPYTRSRLASITWIRRTTYDRGQPIDIMNTGTTFLRHHQQPFAQLLWLLAEAPRFSWHLRRYLRDTINNSTEAMTEYIITFLYLQYINNPDAPPNYRVLDVRYFEVFTDLMINLGNTLQQTYRSAMSVMTAIPHDFPPTAEPSMSYYVYLYNRNG